LIISASRRTDIPAFYSEWLLNRLRAGFCIVANPFNPQQVSQVSLKPDDVDVIVFWTRNPAPLMPHLPELDELGLRYYFQYTLLNNPRLIDQNTLPLPAALKTFQQLAEQIGPERVIWRYDPIVFTPQIGALYHLDSYRQIASGLRGCTFRSVISVVDLYKNATRRLRQLDQAGVGIISFSGESNPDLELLMHGLVEMAAQNGMEITSCAEDLDLAPYGIRPGKCVDDQYIHRVFGIDVTRQKDPAQRPACGCVVSKDIGAYNTCPFSCQYCYATTSFERARAYHAAHDPWATSL
jgi:hypothetical protein